MNPRHVVDIIVAYLKNEPSVEGGFLAGSLLDENLDEYSDVDLGVASADSEAAFQAAHALRGDLIAAVGNPAHHIDREWGHCRMVAALYGKSVFPPVGLEIDLVFSQLQHVGEQMPYSRYEVVFDRAGHLKTVLDRLPEAPPITEVRAALDTNLRAIPFVVHDALKASRRGDSLYAQALLQDMRQAIFQAAAARDEVILYSGKRAYRHLSAFERGVIEETYQDSSEHSVRQLARLYADCLSQMESDEQIGAALEHLENALGEIL